MSEPFLKKITISNFRSILGEITIPLDAPVILIHGKNGVGKTSVLSAIELALTGDISSLRRVDRNVDGYVLHRKAEQGFIEIEAGYDGESSEHIITKEGIFGFPLLLDQSAHFFTERCYLAQATLSKLLDIYQHQDKKNSDSPLTTFVKELLRLDQYDALIDGLHVAGNVKRLKDQAPLYWDAREAIELNQYRTIDNSKQQEELRAMVDERAAKYLPRLKDYVASGKLTVADISRLKSGFQSNQISQTLARLILLRQELATATGIINTYEATPSANRPDLIDSELKAATQAYENWNAEFGNKITALITELGRYVATSAIGDSSEPSARVALALLLSRQESERVLQSIAVNAAIQKKTSELQNSLVTGRSRLATLETQIASISARSGTLATALSSILPHIHSEECPVCSRDYSEMGDVSLGQHVADKIASLIESAGRLQALTKDRADTVASISEADRALATESARLMSGEQLTEAKRRSARLSEMVVAFSEFGKQAVIGGQLLLRQNKAAMDKQLAATSSQSLTLAHSTIANVSIGLDIPIPEEPYDLRSYASHLSHAIESRIEGATKEQASAASCLSELAELEQLILRLDSVVQEGDRLFQEGHSLGVAKNQADERIDIARAVVKGAKELRTDIVRRVFNNDLNAIWRALFIRLAPEEDFVPAFALPEDATAEVHAELETIYRAGGKGGNPRAMLSAGNLNTAALTLFLSLHLSVTPTIPCLIIDDPVQSMDEVHIAQFAALLRTLSKELGRQVVIAVHERALFDYLALELSPSFLGDQLITVELGRAADDVSLANWKLHTFTPDKAVAA